MLSPLSRNQSVNCPSVYRALARTVIDGSLQIIHISLIGHTTGWRIEREESLVEFLFREILLQI